MRGFEDIGSKGHFSAKKVFLGQNPPKGVTKFFGGQNPLEKISEFPSEIPIGIGSSDRNRKFRSESEVPISDRNFRFPIGNSYPTGNSYRFLNF